MNAIRDDFTPKLKKFFINLQNYLDTDIYFYGSVNRPDYVAGKSDIDVAIYTDNEYSIMTKLQHYLHIPRKAFDKIVWKLEGQMIYGYKLKCEKYVSLNEAKKCEIAIYNNDFKDILMKEYYNVIPIHISILLFILKTFYYTIPLLPSNIYVKYKRYIFNTLMLNKQNSVFFLIKQT
jgi:predicted nucleotidyltransferase